jgi:hypothetical protein
MNRATSVCGNKTVSTPVLVLYTRLWPSTVKCTDVTCWMYSAHTISKTYDGLKSFQIATSFQIIVSVHILVGDSVCKFKWNFLTCTKNFRKLSKYYWRLFIMSVIPLGKKVNSKKIINYHNIEKWTVSVVSRI